MRWRNKQGRYWTETLNSGPYKKLRVFQADQIALRHPLLSGMWHLSGAIALSGLTLTAADCARLLTFELRYGLSRYSTNQSKLLIFSFRASGQN